MVNSGYKLMVTCQCRTSRSGYKATILAKRPVISWSRRQSWWILSFLRPRMFNSNSSICAASLRSRMVSECSAGAAVNTCQAVFYQHFILSTDKINSLKTLYNACFPINEDSNLHWCYTPKTARFWRKRQYIPPKCPYLLATTIYHSTRLEFSSTMLSEPNSLNCFNLQYDTCTNYNLMAIEIHNVIL